MTPPKPKYTPDPRAWTAFQVAARFGRGPGWFEKHRAELEAAGFPRHDELSDGWDAKAIEAWWDRHSGLGQTVNDEQAILEAINGKG